MSDVVAVRTGANGPIICAKHIKYVRQEVSLIHADSEWKVIPCCDRCGEPIDVKLKESEDD